VEGGRVKKRPAAVKCLPRGCPQVRGSVEFVVVVILAQMWPSRVIEDHRPMLSAVDSMTQLVRVPVIPRIEPPGFFRPVLMLELEKANLKCS
jgi:hypothetical protein